LKKSFKIASYVMFILKSVMIVCYTEIYDVTIREKFIYF